MAKDEPERAQAALRLSAAATQVGQSVFAALHGRIEAHRRAGGELIPLHIGDTYLRPPVAQSTVDLADLGVYGAVGGMDSLKEAIAAHRRARGHRAAAGAEHVHVTCGCTHAVFCAARAVLDPGDEAIVLSPYWPLVPGVLRTAGVVPVEVAASQALMGGADLDLEAALEQARTPRTRAVYYVSPNNPDGHVMTKAQLDAIAAFAERHDLWVLADEVYADFVYDGEHRHISDRPRMVERTVSTFSLSKSHGLAGARVGYLVAPAEVATAARRMSNYTVYNVPVPMQRAALAAIEDGDAWLDEARSTYFRAREATAAALDEVGIRYHLPAGGSFFFVDLGDRLAGSIASLLERAIDHGVLLAPGEAFGAGFDAYLRLCFTAVPQERVAEGVRRLGRALEPSP